MSDESSTPFLAVATEEERHGTVLSNFAGFGGFLKQEAYIRREASLIDQDLTRDGALTTWVLCLPTADGRRRVLSSCETIRRRAFLTTGGKDVREVEVYGIASVFTSAENRGKRYASQMMKLLGEHIDGEGKAVLSVLYSDIGRTFYAKEGWVARDSGHVLLPPTKNSAAESGDSQVKLLSIEDVTALCIEDEKILQERLRRLASSGKSGFAIAPDAKTVAWMKARETSLSKELHGKTNPVNGALVTTSFGSRVWCFWTHWINTPDLNVPTGNTTHVLRLAVEDPAYDDSPANDEGTTAAKDSETAKAIAAVLAAAQEQAGKWNMGEVMIWNPSSSTLAAARSLHGEAKVEHREKASIASLRISDPELAKVGDGLVWVANEKIVWC